MPPPQLDHHLLRRFVLHRPQFLQHCQAARLQLVLGQMGPPQQVGVDGQRLRQVFGHGGAAVAGVGAGDALGPLDAEIVQVENELPAVALARPAQRHLAGETAQAAAVGGIVDAAGRHQEGEGRRLQRGGRLGHQHQAVRIRMGEDAVSHWAYSASAVL